LANLLRNAIEACQAAGVTPHVRAYGSIEEAHRITRVTVLDNGPGVAPGVLDRIFQPFFTTKKTGTGLGLALVQKIIVTHNGRITVSIPSGGGACFQVTLPIV
jgi:signal transduction histidine kinase